MGNDIMHAWRLPNLKNHISSVLGGRLACAFANLQTLKIGGRILREKFANNKLFQHRHFCVIIAK
jgi:hypothetical protein